MDQPQKTTMQRSYRRLNIPKEKHRIHGMIPAIRDAVCALYEMCTCTTKIRGEVRPATGADEEFFTALADLFRCYRWLAGTADAEDEKEIEEHARTTTSYLRKGMDVIEQVVPLMDPNSANPWIRVSIREAMSCGIQALANCFCLSHRVQDLIWPDFVEITGRIFMLDRSCILLQEDKLLNYVSAAVLNCLPEPCLPDNIRLVQIVTCGDAAAIFESLAQITSREDSLVTFDAAFDLAAKLLRCPMIAQRDFDHVSLGARCAIVDLLSFAFPYSHRNSIPSDMLPPFWAEKMSQVFKSNWKFLLRLREPSPILDQEPELILKALDLLGNITAADALRSVFFCDVELLDCVIDAFFAVDNLGRDGENLFTAVNKLSDVKPRDLVTSSRGLKSLLIRLLANLVYNNPKFIQLASERKILQRLKDHTKIDYRNPYVQQWAILAIRNLHFTDAFDEVRREHVIEAVPEVSMPSRGVSQSVDGDLVGERRLVDVRNSPMKGRSVVHSDTVEALDLHTSFTEIALSAPLNVPSSPSRRKPEAHSGRKRRDARAVKANQGTHTLPYQSDEDRRNGLNAEVIAQSESADPDLVSPLEEIPNSSANASGRPRLQSR